MKPTLVAAAVLAVIGALHLLRLVFGWAFVVGDLTIPMWPSVLVVLLFGALSALLWREGRG